VVAPEPHIRLPTTAGRRIAYATMDEGPILLHLPGWGGSMDFDWKHPGGHVLVERLSWDRVYVQVDHRGIGASQRDVDDVSLEAQVADVAAPACAAESASCVDTLDSDLTQRKAVLVLARRWKA
jgi:hypothetical protein